VDRGSGRHTLYRTTTVEQQSAPSVKERGPEIISQRPHNERPLALLCPRQNYSGEEVDKVRGKGRASKIRGNSSLLGALTSSGHWFVWYLSCAASKCTQTRSTPPLPLPHIRQHGFGGRSSELPAGPPIPSRQIPSSYRHLH